jgi:virulence-associated protein VagC
VSYTPTIKKIIIVGNSQAITLPRGWLAFNAQKYGQALRQVRLQEVGQGLLILPIPPPTKEDKHEH